MERCKLDDMKDMGNDENFLRLAETGIHCQGAEGQCDSKNATRRRQNTQYADDSLNWVILCDECQKVNEAYWAERWAEYYSDKL